MMNHVTRALTVSLAVVAAGSIVIGAGAAQDSSGSQSDPALVAQKFRRVPIQGPLGTNVKPRVLDQTLIKVVAILGGDSVAQQQEVSGRRLTRQEKNVIKAHRGAEQAAVRPSVEAAGGRIVNTFQSALNGIKLTIPRNRVDELRNIPGVIDVRPVGVYRHENVVSVPRMQAPFAWSGVLGVRGEGAPRTARSRPVTRSKSRPARTPRCAPARTSRAPTGL